MIRCADDTALLCKTRRAAEGLLESNTHYPKRKLNINLEKNHIAKANATKNFKFMGFA